MLFRRVAIMAESGIVRRHDMRRLRKLCEERSCKDGGSARRRCGMGEEEGDGDGTGTTRPVCE